MKNKDIKKLIQNECQQINLPLSSNITEYPIQEKSPFQATKNNKFFKFILAFVSCIIFIVAIFPIANSIFNKHSDITSFILEINPSICLTTDSSDKIISICSLSNDGDILLSDERFENIIGENLDNGLKSIIDASVDLGYFENYNKRIILFAVNNKESFAIEKTRTFEGLLSKHLEEHELSSIEIEKGCMSIPDFKRRMSFENNSQDLDKMKEDICNLPKYFDKNFNSSPPPMHY